ncbi:Extra-large guanine nucleotide-binding protein 1 [Ananas comosus]|uniref:Extra-large guanine nucleotide-binding protein 1 n=1 Tax=Ananas comosus TaxID=4615 RepID=A0A199VPJ8_ANACO|nr:Extra-large guanine nucleotide-binding protein 1 [Ananas comosus]
MAETADYSFAVEYHGPPLPYDIPKAIPIEIERIPVAAVAPPSASDAAEALPVVHPLTSPLRKAAPTPAVEHAAAAAAAASPTSVIENHAVMDGPDAEAGSSGLLGSSSCLDRSAELTEGGVESSGPVGSSLPDRISTESALSLEFDFRSSASENDDDDEDDDEGVAPHAKKALVTFQSSAQSSGSASPAVGLARQRREEFELRGKKGACYHCLKGSRFAEKEACLVCDAKYCSGCVLRAMGSMPEGRKCVSCIGFPVLESKRERLGKCSRMLRRLLSSPEIELAMKAEKNCEANQLRPEDIFVNGKKLTPEELVLLQNCSCPPPKLKPGYYWYDKVSGFWGKEGHKPHKIITAHLNVGGSLDSRASNGNTGIFINGREITKAELQMLKWAGVQCAGNPHFWLNADGTYQEEGQKNIKGQIWGKPIMKLLCPVLSLPTPTKAANSNGDEVIDMVRAIPDYLEQRTVQKMLLVGLHGSGTSTIIKQAKFLYRGVPFSNDERQDIKGVKCLKKRVWLREGTAANILVAAVLRGNMLAAGNYESDDCNRVTDYSFSPRLRELSDWLLKVMASGNLDTSFPTYACEYAPLVEELWNDAAIQATYRRRSELLMLPITASYFLERYEPSDKDILYADRITSSNGIACTDFSFGPLACDGHAIDGDQQDMLLRYQLIRIHTKGLGQNCKWLDMFEDIKIVLFCIALSDYDEYYEDPNGVLINKMIESKRLFENLVTHPTFEEMNFLLILNKFDLLEQKIDTSPLTICEWFSDFNPVVSRNQPSNTRNPNSGATMAQQAFHHIAVKFKRLFSSITGRRLYVTWTNGLAQDTVDAALRYGREILIWEEEKPIFGSSESIYSTEPSSYSN